MASNRHLTAAIGLVTVLAIAACGEGGAKPLESSATAPAESATVMTGGSRDCPTKDGVSWKDSDDVTLGELTDRMAEALTCPEYVVHIEARGEFNFDGLRVGGVSEYWIDVNRNLGRSEESPEIEPLTEESRRLLESSREEVQASEEPRVTIIRSDGRYVSSERGEAERVWLHQCLGPNLEALALLIDCLELEFASEITVEEQASYKNMAVVTLVAKDGDEAAGDRYWSTFTFYLDPESFVPLGSSSEMVSPATLDDPTRVESSALFEYAVDFVPADSLPADFFHPDSIGGYEAPDPLATAYAIDAPVYWLGEEFPGDGAFPAVTLVHAFPAPPELADTFPASMTYRPSGDAPEFDITVQTYPSLEAGGEHSPPASACLRTRSVDVSGTQARIYSLPPSTPGPMDDEAPCRPPGIFFAGVTIDGVAVKVTTFTIRSHNPYNSEAGIELLVRSLKRRE